MSRAGGQRSSSRSTPSRDLQRRARTAWWLSHVILEGCCVEHTVHTPCVLDERNAARAARCSACSHIRWRQDGALQTRCTVGVTVWDGTTITCAGGSCVDRMSFEHCDGAGNGGAEVAFWTPRRSSSESRGVAHTVQHVTVLAWRFAAVDAQCGAPARHRERLRCSIRERGACSEAGMQLQWHV